MNQGAEWCLAEDRESQHELSRVARIRELDILELGRERGAGIHEVLDSAMHVPGGPARIAECRADAGAQVRQRLSAGGNKMPVYQDSDEAGGTDLRCIEHRYVDSPLKIRADE